MSFYTINVSLNGKHYFATAEHSLTSGYDAAKALHDFRTRFPKEEGFNLGLSYNPERSFTSYKTDLYEIKDTDLDKYVADFGK